MSWATEADLKNALNANIWIHIFDEDGDGSVDEAQANVLLVLERSYHEVLSYMPNLYDTLPGASPVISLLKSCQLDFAVTLALEKRPELARSMGNETIEERWKRADARMDRIRKSIQRLTDNAPGGADPANVGGTVVNGTAADPDTPVKTFSDMGDF